MTPLVVAMLLLALIAFAWLTRPLWQREAGPRQARRGANVQAYQTRLQELDAEVASGLIEPAQAEALRQELKQRLVEDAAASEPAEAARRAAPRSALLLASLLLVAAGLAYWQVGSWRVAQEIAQAPAAESVPSETEVRAMVQRLADKLAANPDNAQGWAMLGRSYFTLQRFADAARAYGEANARAAEPQADWLSSEGEALALARDRDLLGRPRELFEAALKIDPLDGKSLWYAGLAAAQAGDDAAARAHWQQLLAQDVPDDIRKVLQERLVVLGGAPAPASTAATQSEAVGAAAALTLQVTLAPELVNRHSADQTLFLFAKAVNGPPMPLAVQRIPGATLPITLTLDDSMAMAPSLKLSQFDRYVITARLSATGGAVAQRGDLEGRVEAVRGQRGTISVVVDRAVP